MTNVTRRTLLPGERAAILAEVQQGYPYDAIARRYGITKQTVSKIAVRNGARRNNKQGILSSAQVAEMTSRYQAGERSKDIAASFGVTKSTVWEVLRRTGVPARPPGAVPFPLRHDALDVLTPEAAYWCGIFFTDGTVGKRPERRQHEVAVVLQKRDRGHLVKLREFLGSVHAITPVAPAEVAKTSLTPYGGRGKGAFRFAISSSQIGERLLALGRYGPAVDPELAASRDFWRGVVDGDGTVSVSCGIPQVKALGTRWLLSAFVDFLGPVSSSRPLNVRPARSIYVVSTSYQTAVKVVDRLYVGATVALDRKAAMAERILSM